MKSVNHPKPLSLELNDSACYPPERTSPLVGDLVSLPLCDGREMEPTLRGEKDQASWHYAG